MSNVIFPLGNGEERSEAQEAYGDTLPVDPEVEAAKAIACYRLFSQDAIWIDAKKREHLIIAMPIGYRANVMRYIVKNAAHLEERYTMGETMAIYHHVKDEHLDGRTLDEEWDRRTADPAAFMRSTELYKALDSATWLDGDDGPPISELVPNV
jgi:hypothetical protein